MSAKKTTYGLKAYGIGPFVKEVVFESQTLPISNWTNRTDTVVENWTKRNPSNNTWNNGNNG